MKWKPNKSTNEETQRKENMMKPEQNLLIVIHVCIYPCSWWDTTWNLNHKNACRNLNLYISGMDRIPKWAEGEINNPLHLLRKGHEPLRKDQKSIYKLEILSYIIELLFKIIVNSNSQYWLT